MLRKVNKVAYGAQLILSIVGVATASTALGGAGAAVTGILSIGAIFRRLPPEVQSLQKAITTKLDKALHEPDRPLPKDADILLPQMLEVGIPTAAEVMQAGRDANALTNLILSKLHDREHRSDTIRRAFRQVFKPLFTEVLNDPAIAVVLQPAFQTFMVQTLTQVANNVDKLTTQLAQTSKKLGLTEGLVIGLARRIALDVEDFDTACRELERAIDTAAKMNQQALLPANTGDQVEAVLKRMTELNEAGELDAAAEVVDRALAGVEAEAATLGARKARLLEIALEQDILRRNPGSAAERLLARLVADQPDPDLRFAALRALQVEWYQRGRDKGLNFDAEVAIFLAQATCDLARTPEQRGTALNDLGNTLQTLGQREQGTARLDDAVTAYRRVLKVWTREAVPLDWAATQNNLGNVLMSLGQREQGTAQLDEAVTAFCSALEVWTREAVPLDWAMIQNNLGVALQALGEREQDTARLDAAVTAYRRALEVRTREAVPLDWATTQNNLGSALQTLGQREQGTERIDEAVTAFCSALEVLTRKDEPLKWATTHNNLGNALMSLGKREQGTGRLDEAVTAYRHALEIRTRKTVPLEWATTQNNLGAALKTLGEREQGTGRLDEAVTAYRRALEIWTRESVPLNWASARNNLAALELAFFDKTHEPAHLDAAEAHAQAARKVFAAAQASRYLGMIDAILARIAARRA